MARCPFAIWLPGPEHGPLVSVAAVCHMTYGAERGDVAVGTGARGGISFHLYVTKKGVVYQFVDTSRVAWHAKGANSWSVGIEVEGRNEDGLWPDAQVQGVARVVMWLTAEHGYPLRYYDSGRAGARAGYVAHNAIAGSDHTDRWGANWDRVMAVIHRKVPTLQRYVYIRDVQNPAGPGGWTLDGWGGCHPWGGAPTVLPPGYWLNWNICRDLDLVLNPDGATVGYKLDGYGGLHPWENTTATSGPAFTPNDLARRIVLLRDGERGVFRYATDWNLPAGAVIDAWGGIHPLNGATPADFAGHPWWEGGMVQEVSAPA